MAGDDVTRAEAGGGVTPPTGPNGGERRQSMRGFEDGYADIGDWIVRITDRIEEDPGHRLHRRHPQPRLHGLRRLRHGLRRRAGGRGATQSIHAFPGSRHYADDVIWAGDDEEGFATSHRAINIGHHTGRGGGARPPAGASTCG